MLWHFSAENWGPVSISLSLGGLCDCSYKQTLPVSSGLWLSLTLRSILPLLSVTHSGHHTARSPSHIERWGMKCHVKRERERKIKAGGERGALNTRHVDEKTVFWKWIILFQLPLCGPGTSYPVKSFQSSKLTKL